MKEAIGTLCAYSLLTRRNDGVGEPTENFDRIKDPDPEEWFDMHRLVHLATQMWTKEFSEQSVVADETMRHVAKIFPNDDYANRRIWRAHLPHALRLLRTTQNRNVEGKAELCYLVGRCLIVDGRIQEAVTWLEELCRLISVLESNHPVVLSAQHVLAIVYQRDGQTRRAIDILEPLIAVRSEVLEPKHPNLLASQHALVKACREDGQIKKAIELLVPVVKIRDRVLADDHPSRVASVHNLALLYREDGQLQKAIDLMESVVEIWTHVLRVDHPYRLVSLQSLATAYGVDG
jgi:tetratricopeptide (TPR) repeat protein